MSLEKDKKYVLYVDNEYIVLKYFGKVFCYFDNSVKHAFVNNKEQMWLFSYTELLTQLIQEVKE